MGGCAGLLLDPVLVLHIDCINKMVKEYASKRIFLDYKFLLPLLRWPRVGNRMVRQT